MLALNTARVGNLVRADDGSLLDDDGLETVVTISLFTDARASEDEVPAGTDRRGWWFDAYDPDEPGVSIGSKIWLLENATMTAENLRLLERYAKDALEWMVAANAAEKIETEATRIAEDAASLTVRIHAPNDPASPYTYTWELHFGVD